MSAMSYYTEYYKRNREAMNARTTITNRNLRQRNRDYLNQIRSKAVCPDCGLSFPDKPWRMSFDHLPGFEKKADLSTMANQAVSLKRLDEEIAKCEVICLFCHSDRTQLRRIEGM